MTDKFEVQRFARDFARRLAKLERSQRRTAASPNTLNHAAIDGGELVVKDGRGQVKYHLGTDPVTGVTAPKFEPGPAPAQPEAPDLEAREGAVHVELSGLDVDENPAPADLKHAEIHMSLDEGFEVSPGTMVTSTPNPADGVSISKAAGIWWVRVVWVTLSGQRSEPSESVSVDIVPPVDAQDIEDTLAEAEQIIADAVAAAQLELDELRDRLDNFEGFDPTDLIAQISQVTEDLADARQEAAGLVSDLADRVDDIKIPDVSGFITQAEVDAAAEAAETAAKEHADLVAQGAKDEAIAEAETKANAAKDAAEQAAKDYADQQDAQVKIDAAADAQTKADAAQAEAERLAAEHAELVATGAKDDAIAEAERLHGLAIAEAEAAQDRADEAHANAGTAWDHADAAMTRAGAAETNAKQHADALPKMLGGSTAPTGTAPNGSIWFQRDSNNTVIGRWERIGGSWVQQEVSGELIDNLEAGKITALNTEFAESVIGKLWTQLAIVDRLIATSAWIGGAMIGDDAVEAKHIVASETLSGKVAEFLKLNVADLVATGAQVDDAVINKLWVDGLVALSATLARATVASQNLIPGMSRIHEATPPPFKSGFGRNSGHPSIWVRSGDSDHGDNTVTTSGDDDALIHLEASEVYRFRVGVAASKSGTTAYMALADENGDRVSVTRNGSNSSYLLVNHEAGSTATRPEYYEAEIVPPYSGAFRLIFYANHTNGAPNPGSYQWFHGLTLANMLDGSLIVEDTIRTRHLHVTQEMVGEFAKFMHLVVDQMNVNELWADQTWQAAGHFGSEEGDYRTLLDAMGLSIFRQVEGEEQLATRLGPGENALSFFDEDTGRLTGGLSQDGSAQLGETAVQSLSVAGRDLTRAPHEYQTGVPLLDSMPRGVWEAGPVDMAGVEVQNQRLGFLELSAPVIKGRMYRLTTSNFLTGLDKEYRARFRYTLCEDGMQVPTVQSPELAMWVPNATNSNVQAGGRVVFEAEQTGVIRVLLCLETRLSSISGIRFNNSATFAGDVRFWMEDLGPRKPGNSRRRYSVSGGDDPTFLDDTPGENTYITEWESTWMEAYRNGGETRRTNENYGVSSLVQGLNPRYPGENWTSLAGFSGATSSSHDSELGLNFREATSGAKIHNVELAVTGGGSLGADPRFFPEIHWASPAVIPPTYRRVPSTLMATPRVDPGWEQVTSIPPEFWPLLQTGDWRSIGLAKTPSSITRFNGWLEWRNAKPRIIVTYQK